MTKFALFLGDAPEDFRQKKIDEMNDFLSSDAGGNFQVATFANGISEIMLEAVLNNAFGQLAEVVVEPVETTAKENQRQSLKSAGERHFEQVAHHSDLQKCHSELDSESANEMLNQVQNDGKDCRVKPDNDRNRKPDNDEKAEKASFLLYTCTRSPVAESEKSFWLVGEEIRKDVILHYQKIAEESGIAMQVVFDVDAEVVAEEKLSWEDV